MLPGTEDESAKENSPAAINDRTSEGDQQENLIEETREAEINENDSFAELKQENFTAIP